MATLAAGAIVGCSGGDDEGVTHQIDIHAKPIGPRPGASMGGGGGRAKKAPPPADAKPEAGKTDAAKKGADSKVAPSDADKPKKDSGAKAATTGSAGTTGTK